VIDPESEKDSLAGDELLLETLNKETMLPWLFPVTNCLFLAQVSITPPYPSKITRNIWWSRQKLLVMCQCKRRKRPQGLGQGFKGMLIWTSWTKLLSSRRIERSREGI
jgi:hypothetical protein